MTTFIVPNNAVINSEIIKTESGMIIGNHAEIGRNLHVGLLMAGESVHVTGQIISDADIRADVWCKFDGDIFGGGDAYLGEFTTINGKITVEGDLDVGKEVKLNGGFLSKGWIVVRNPLPIMVFVFLYIRELMRIGKTSEEIDKTLNEFFEDDEEIDLENLDEAGLSEILNRGRFFIIPLGSKVSSENINVPEDASIGNNCVIDGSLICKKFESGKNLNFRGSLRSKGETTIADGSNFSGNLNASGKLIIGKNVKIEGHVSARSIVIHETSFIEGTVSCGNIRFAAGDDFDIQNPQNRETATILSKSDSFERIKTNITKKEAKSEYDEEKEFAEVSSNAEAAAIDSKAVENKISENEGAENETVAASAQNLSVKSSANSSDPKIKKDPLETKGGKSSASKKNSRNTKPSKIDDLEIVNVFTGENIENSRVEEQNQ